MNTRSLTLRLALWLTALVALIFLSQSTGQWLGGLFVLIVVDSLLAPTLHASRCYDNQLGQLTPNLIVARALELVFTVRPVLNNVSLGFQDLDSGSVEANYNASVYTRTLAIPAVGNFGDAAANRADTDVSVTLNNFKQVFYSFKSTEYSGTNRNLIDESAMPLAVAIANYMVDQIASQWTAGNFPNATPIGAGWSYANTLLPVRKALMQRGVPKGYPWFLAVNSDVYTSLLSDPIIVAALNNPANANAIQTGQLPITSGLAIDEYPSLANGNLIGFGGAKDSCVYAARVPKNPETIPGFDAKFPGNIEVITEPKTKLSVMLNTWIGTDLTANVRLCWMFGLGKGNNNNGQRVIPA
jgi:hypothetical protein